MTAREQRCSQNARGLIPERYVSLNTSLGEIISSQEPIKRRAERSLSVLRNSYLRMLPLSELGLSRAQHRIMSGRILYTGEHEVYLLLQLHRFIVGGGLPPVVNVPYVFAGKGDNYYGMSLRRSLEAIAGRRSWRRPPPLPKKEEVHLSELQQEGLGCRNRYAILAHNLYGEDSSSESWVESLDTEDKTTARMPPFQKDTYITRAETNQMRARLGYPPKGDASVDSDRYRQGIKRHERYHTLRRVGIYVSRVARELQEHPGVIINDEIATTAISNYFCLERLNEEYKLLGGRDLFSPTPWDGDPYDPP